MITHQPDISKICLYDNDPFEAKLQLLINKREYTDLKYCKDLKLLLNA